MRVRVYDSELRPNSGPGNARSIERSFDVRPAGKGRHRLELSGALGWRWAEPLCRGLARTRIAVRRGFALSVGDGLWRAAFELEAAEDGADPRQGSVRSVFGVLWVRLVVRRCRGSGGWGRW